MKTIGEGGNQEEWEICTSNQKELAQKLTDFWAKYTGMELVNECEITGVIGGWKEWRIITENQLRISGIIDVISQAILLGEKMSEKMSEKTREKRGIPAEKMSEKMSEKTREKRGIPAAIISTATSMANAAIYDAAKLGIEYIFKQDKDKFLPRSAIVAFIEDPDRRLQNGIYKTYGKIFPDSLEGVYVSSGKEEFLCLLQGKRIFDEKWSENEVDIKDEQKIIILLQLWSLLKYVGYENEEYIYSKITEKWEKLKLSSGTCYGKFWNIPCSSGALAGRLTVVQAKGTLWKDADDFELKTLKETYQEARSHLSKEGIIFF